MSHASKTISCIIVDDESSARTIMKSFIEKYCPSLRIVGIAENIIEAKQLITQKKPQLVFLDIEMPHGTAFDLLDKFVKVPFHIIFITAYAQYAVQAFNIASAKYLLKPIDIDALVAAVTDITTRIQTEEKSQLTHILLENLRNKQMQKVIIPLIDGFEIIETNEILYIKADDNYSEFYLASGKKIVACKKLKFYEDNLSDHGFLRIHRSTIVNLDKIKKYQKGKGGVLVLHDGTHLDVSQSRKNSLLDIFKR